LGQEYLAFLLLNLFDLFLTGYIFRHNGSEANGVALYILKHFQERSAGLAAFAIYKFLMVSFIVIICEVVATRSVGKARLIMLVGCITYFGIVLYESYGIYFYITNPALQTDTGAAAISLIGCFLPHLR
jgi:hypothetical protein